MQATKIAILVVLLAACYRATAAREPAPVDVAPAVPAFAGQYDFDLLEPVRGKACVKQTTRRRVYWAPAFPLPRTPADPLVLSAISAASADAIAGVPDADTILVTRVITEPQRDQACAWVYGRAVRIKKAGEPTEPALTEEAEPARVGPFDEPHAVDRATVGSYNVFDHPRPPLRD